jgi:signal peptidase I
MAAQIMQDRTNADASPRLNWRRGSIAFLLSLVQPGVGHIYARRPSFAIAYFLAVTVLLVASWVMGLNHTFTGFAVLVVFQLALYIAVVIPATRVAIRQSRGTALPSVSKPIFRTAIVLAVLLLAGNISGFFLDHVAGLRAFVIRSESMSPTMVTGDRVVADVLAYRHEPPKLGDVVVFVEPGNHTIFTKRVLGLPGDVVAGNQGQPVCSGKPLSLAPASPPTEGSGEFEPRTVPPGHLFLIGDNYENSYDSRYFGPVQMSALKGKVLFIYWSPHHCRIGKPVH